jgi:RNA polymerase primary sigma factor
VKENAPVDGFSRFLTEIGRTPLLTAAEEVELAKRVERGDRAARRRMIEANLRLVVHLAKRFQREDSGMTLLDLIQEGTIGLIRATEKYDWRRGLRFSTYASLWIRQAIGKALTEKSRAIRLPAEVARKEWRIERARDELVHELGRTPTVDELAAAADMRTAEVEELDRAARVVTSLDRPAGEPEAETPLRDWLPASEEVSNEVMLRLDRATVRRAVAQLGEPASSVVRARFGLDGDPEPLSYSKIARRLKLTQRRVRTIELRALEDLARLRELQGLSDAA